MSAPLRPARDTHRVDALLVQGIAWTGGLKWLTHLTSWAIALIVARLVTPNGYGLFAMAVVYTGFVQLVNELGLDIALVQRRALPEEDIAQLGGLAVLAGLGFCAVSIVVSPGVAAFFGERALRGVLVALSFTFVTRGAQVVPRALLARELNFRRLAWINTLETSLWSVSTLIGATLGFGYWALVGGALLSGLVTTIVLCAWRPHRLAWPHDVRALAGTTNLAWLVLVSQICWYLYDHADLTLVGWALGKATLGAYAKASDIADVPVDRISALVGQVTPAVFAASQREVATLKRHLLGLTEGLALVTFPMSVGLALTADVFVLSVLGEAWRPAIMPLRLLGLLGGFRAVFNLFPQMLIATGHARLNAKMNVIMAVAVTLALCAGTHWGSVGVATSWVVSVPLVAIPCFFRPGLRILGIRTRDYLHTLWPATSAAAGVAATVLVLRILLPRDWPATLVLAFCAMAGVAAYLGVLLTAHRARTLAAIATVTRLGRGVPESHGPRPASAVHVDPATPPVPIPVFVVQPGSERRRVADSVIGVSPRPAEVAQDSPRPGS